MGLDTTHDCWHGAYSAFMRWRQVLAEVAGLPPLDLMEGFFNHGSSGSGALYFGQLTPLWQDKADRLAEQLPIRWDCLKPSPLHELLSHSDCDGEIPWESCDGIADALEGLLPALEAKGDGGGHIGMFAEKTQTFIAGLRKAAAAQENVRFH